MCGWSRKAGHKIKKKLSTFWKNRPEKKMATENGEGGIVFFCFVEMPPPLEVEIKASSMIFEVGMENGWKFDTSHQRGVRFHGSLILVQF